MQLIHAFESVEHDLSQLPDPLAPPEHDLDRRPLLLRDRVALSGRIGFRHRRTTPALEVTRDVRHDPERLKRARELRGVLALAAPTVSVVPSGALCTASAGMLLSASRSAHPSTVFTCALTTRV